MFACLRLFVSFVVEFCKFATCATTMGNDAAKIAMFRDTRWKFVVAWNGHVGCEFERSIWGQYWTNHTFVFLRLVVCGGSWISEVERWYVGNCTSTQDYVLSRACLNVGSVSIWAVHVDGQCGDQIMWIARRRCCVWSLLGLACIQITIIPFGDRLGQNVSSSFYSVQISIAMAWSVWVWMLNRIMVKYSYAWFRSRTHRRQCGTL